MKEQLTDEYYVFHSVGWHKKERGQVKWGEADFLIYNPHRGIIVLEIKAGGIERRQGNWYQTNTNTGETNLMKDPLGQANKSKYAFIDMLTPPGQDAGVCWIESAVWFPSLKERNKISPLPPDYRHDIVLLEQDLEHAKKSIESLYDYYGMQYKSYVDEAEVSFVIDTLSPSFNVVASLSSKMEEENARINRLTEEQSRVLDFLEEQTIAAIHGSAGTGKTMIAVSKAERLSKDGTVLFLCFNRFLLQFLRSSNANNNPNIDFYNLSSLVMSKTGIPYESIDNNTISAFLEEIDLDAWPYKHIVIDEAQDFLAEHLHSLNEITDLMDGAFYIFYDRNQIVQQPKDDTGLIWTEWVNNMDCKLVLSANCRNTESIAVTSYKPVGIEKYQMRMNAKGSKPGFYICDGQPGVVSTLAKIIRSYTDKGLQKSDIVILTVKTEETSILANVSSLESYRLASMPEDQGILFTTSRKYKGLESPVVIVIDIDEKTFADIESRRRLYVAASRAKHELALISAASNDQLEKMAEYIEGKKVKNARLSLAQQLKVKIISQKE